ncbi:class I adenylate-forming enzyme family protein [Jatrophihabitans sp. DSM 45814]
MSTTRWGDAVTRGVIHGHSSLVYEEHPDSVGAVLIQSRRWGQRPFIFHGDRVVTFADHEQIVRRVAARLRCEAIGRGDRVGIYAANSPEWVATFFGILEAGAIAVPCNGWWSAEEMEHACEVAQPSVIIADDKRSSRVPHSIRRIGFAALTEPDDTDEHSKADAVLHPEQHSEDDPAVILFTAGTTNFPKGATLSHRALIANLQSLLIVANKLPHQIPDDIRASVALVGLPLFHIGAIQLIMVPLMTGSQIVFLEGRFDGGEVLSLVEGRGVTMFSGVPTMMERLLAHPDLATRDVTSLRTVVLGGAPVDDGLLSRIAAAFPSTSRGVGQTYGLTEAGGVVSTGVGGELRKHAGSSGRLAPVVEVQIRHADEDGNGEIFVRSPAAMDGYWGLIGDTTIDAEGWIRTGDIGHVDEERYLYITGRSKDMIIRGGENIAPARIEAVLREHPAVAEVTVIGLAHDDLGELVAAVVRLSRGAHVSGEELAAFAAHRLAHFEMPARWIFRDDALPTNDSGKILKSALRTEYASEAVIR